MAYQLLGPSWPLPRISKPLFAGLHPGRDRGPSRTSTCGVWGVRGARGGAAWLHIRGQTRWAARPHARASRLALGLRWRPVASAGPRRAPTPGTRTGPRCCNGYGLTYGRLERRKVYSVHVHTYRLHSTVHCAPIRRSNEHQTKTRVHRPPKDTDSADNATTRQTVPD